MRVFLNSIRLLLHVQVLQEAENDYFRNDSIRETGTAG